MTSLPTTWTDRTTIDLEGLRVTLAEPVLVRRTQRYGWFPSLIRQGNGDLWACIPPIGDVEAPCSPLHLARSTDQGLTWDEPRLIMDGGTNYVPQPDGSVVLLPSGVFRRHQQRLGGASERRDEVGSADEIG